MAVPKKKGPQGLNLFLAVAVHTSTLGRTGVDSVKVVVCLRETGDGKDSNCSFCQRANSCERDPPDARQTCLESSVVWVAREGFGGLGNGSAICQARMGRDNSF